MDWVAVDKGMLSRLLYSNPVCLLSVRSSNGSSCNLMTISWITAINNKGKFICSMNATRHTAKFMNQAGAIFVLNVPVRGMEKLILAIGGCSGAHVDKFDQFNTKKQKLSEKEIARQEIVYATRQSIAVRDCVAHLLCRVDSVMENDGHLLLWCSQLAGWTRRAYWDGYNFISQDGTDVEPYLTFLGSKVFGYVVPADSVSTRKRSKDA
ncbi:unnamed protein product [Peronospora destructor]|uniref:Flavin reductase like domain-containing protein n=1 Tax=Peronospora destructor TaxID=86335 RepID=A0AAV0USE1_9STRA|nr:unnamed protein product [Peronospora destructor]